MPLICTFTTSKASKPEKTLEGGRNRGGELRHKRMSETDMTLHEKAYTDTRLKDSKSCNDLKVSYLLLLDCIFFRCSVRVQGLRISAEVLLLTVWVYFL